ncbi:ATP-binding domain-containing protein [Lactococcus raffinolactis]|uniref:ATP-binding domain-containing protein n=1 Tax=Pseudolactococcus raffinolactis TaxID=1366 RepID=UPI0039A3D50E
MKGWIIGINLFEDESGSEIIEFDIEVDKIINGLEAEGASFELLENSINGNSVIRFSVNKYKNTDDDDYLPSNEAPFQIAYAVSIHKAQGLEYSSVKLVVADEVEDMITHSIFYTAITRARDKLRIYWTPETQNKILSNIKPIENSTDVALLKFRINNLNK